MIATPSLDSICVQSEHKVIPVSPLKTISSTNKPLFLNIRAYFNKIDTGYESAYTFLTPDGIIEELEIIAKKSTCFKPEKMYHYCLYVVDTITRDFIKKRNSQNINYSGCQIHSVMLRRILGINTTKEVTSTLIENRVIKIVGGYTVKKNSIKYALCTQANQFRDVVAKPEYRKISQKINYNHNKHLSTNADLELYRSFLNNIELCKDWKDRYESEEYVSLMLLNNTHSYKEHCFSYSKRADSNLKALEAIANKKWFCYRPEPLSRVHTNLTNLKRLFRGWLRYEDRAFVEIDVRNSQPLLATILINQWCLDNIGIIPKDVKKYQSNCEEGLFYESFKEYKNEPDRSKFKEKVFAQTFFSKVTNHRTSIKEQFMSNYPTVHRAICEIKGGLKSKSYNQFAIKLQIAEAQLIFDRINLGLLSRGKPCFNIFDSILCLPEDEELVLKTMKHEFSLIGLRPSFNFTRYK